MWRSICSIFMVDRDNAMSGGRDTTFDNEIIGMSSMTLRCIKSKKKMSAALQYANLTQLLRLVNLIQLSKWTIGVRSLSKRTIGVRSLSKRTIGVLSLSKQTMSDDCLSVT